MASFSMVQAQLLAMRNEMRIMTGILEGADDLAGVWPGLYDQFQDEVEEQTGNGPSWLEECSSECGPSYPFCATSADAARIKALEDENAKLRRELQDRQNFIVAAASMVAKTNQDMRKTEAPTFPNTMSTLKMVG